MALITWVVFGSAVVGQNIGSFSWQIVLTVVCTIILSILGHGLSAHPLVKALVKSK